MKVEYICGNFLRVKSNCGGGGDGNGNSDNGSNRDERKKT